MRVLYLDGEELILKEVITIQVGRGQVLLESTHGDKRQHVVPDASWSNEDLLELLREQSTRQVIDLEQISRPRV